ncbi:Uncharacterised protein [Mycobacteroides abscessus subsp. abscessus]|nr:Uncharacterised protein [Mycobacteroides abscessus subsp. abscessus]
MGVGSTHRVLGRGVFRHHEGPVRRDGQQCLPDDLIGNAITTRPRVEKFVDGVECCLDDLCVEFDEVLDLRPVPYTPILAGTPRAVGEGNRFSDKAIGRCGCHRPDAHPGFGEASKHLFEPRGSLMPPVPEQLGVERCDDQRGSADPLRFRDQACANVFDEVVDLAIDHRRDAVGVVGLLIVRRNGFAGHARHLEAGRVVVGVEVAVGGVARISRFGRPHLITHGQVAAEGEDVGVPDGSRERGVAVQRGAVDHEMSYARSGILGLHSRRERALGRPDPLRRSTPS